MQTQFFCGFFTYEILLFCIYVFVFFKTRIIIKKHHLFNAAIPINNTEDGAAKNTGTVNRD